MSNGYNKERKHINDTGIAFWNYLDALGESRQLSLAKTKVEEAMLWAREHIDILERKGDGR